MPAFNSSSKQSLSGLSTTLNARSTVFQPGSSGKPTSSSALVFPLTSNSANTSSVVVASHPVAPRAPQHHPPQQQDHHHHPHHQQVHHRSSHRAHQRSGGGYHRRGFKQPFFNDFHGGHGGHAEPAGSILKMHDELPQQAIQAWERYRTERTS